MPDSKTYILDDLPTDIDALDFTPYVETLVDVCKTASTPLTIGVFGTWGSGKTSLMRMVRKKLPRNHTVAWFDAWKYDKEETLADVCKTASTPLTIGVFGAWGSGKTSLMRMDYPGV